MKVGNIASLQYKKDHCGLDRNIVALLLVLGWSPKVPFSRRLMNRWPSLGLVVTGFPSSLLNAITI